MIESQIYRPLAPEESDWDLVGDLQHQFDDRNLFHLPVSGEEEMIFDDDIITLVYPVIPFAIREEQCPHYGTLFIIEPDFYVDKCQSLIVRNRGQRRYLMPSYINHYPWRKDLPHDTIECSKDLLSCFTEPQFIVGDDGAIDDFIRHAKENGYLSLGSSYRNYVRSENVDDYSFLFNRVD